MNTPLAERMRPKTLEQYVNQKHLVGDNAPIKVMLDNGLLASMILWGPPGTGKTTLAQLLAELSGREFYTLSAINAGVKEVREVIEQAKKKTLFSSEKIRFCL